MRNLFKNSLLIIGGLWTLTASSTNIPYGNSTGIWSAVVTLKHNDGSLVYYTSFTVSGPTEQACQTELDNATIGTNAWEWTYCSLSAVNDLGYPGYINQRPQTTGGNNGNSGGIGIDVDQVAAEVAELASRYNLDGYQVELDELDSRYGIIEFKTKMIEIYQQATLVVTEE